MAEKSGGALPIDRHGFIRRPSDDAPPAPPNSPSGHFSPRTKCGLPCPSCYIVAYLLSAPHVHTFLVVTLAVHTLLIVTRAMKSPSCGFHHEAGALIRKQVVMCVCRREGGSRHSRTVSRLSRNLVPSIAAKLHINGGGGGSTSREHSGSGEWQPTFFPAVWFLKDGSVSEGARSLTIGRGDKNGASMVQPGVGAQPSSPSSNA